MDQLLHALGDWENTLKKSEYEKKQEFVLENEIRLQQLVDDVRAELRERIGNAALKPRRLRFEVFSLADCYAGNLGSLLRGLLRMAPMVASEQEGERLIANLQAIESQIIEAQRVTKPEGEAYQKLHELERLKILPDDVLASLHEDLSENFADLNVLLKDANQGLERVRALQNRFGANFDTAHLSVIINIHDLESLKKIYHFVDNITIMDIKRFGVIYKQKNTIMEDIYQRAYNNDPSIPPTITKIINNKLYKAFMKSKHVPIELKTAMLRDIPELLEFEGELLTRTLNLVASDQVRNKAVYRGLLKILEQAPGANLDRRRMIRRIWVKFRNKLLSYKPRNFKKNFDNNTRALMTDAKAILKSSLDDI